MWEAEGGSASSCQVCSQCVWRESRLEPLLQKNRQPGHRDEPVSMREWPQLDFPGVEQGRLVCQSCLALKATGVVPPGLC